MHHGLVHPPPISDDTQFAATTLVHGMTVVTRDADDFAGTGL